MKRRSQQGVALVITLIMLAVITVVAVAFLALARRDRAAATAAEDLSRAEQMADAARERALAEIVAQMMGANDLLAFDLYASKNVDTGINGLMDPRAPVYAVNRPAGSEAFTNLTFLDLDRNGRKDVLPNGEPLDPEFIAVPERFGPHSADNPFIGRYAYWVQPAGKSLDINFGFNQTKMLGTNLDGYFRAQGLGSWDINLAAFLSDLNTNMWPPQPPALDYYNYNPVLGLGNFSHGRAFDDALSLFRYRLDGTYFSLSNASPPLGFELGENTNFWSGSENPRRFYDVSELFTTKPRKDQHAGFIANLRGVMTNNNDYDRQTFYRMMAQMGMDSVPDEFDQTDPEFLRGDREQSRKVNLNYVNLRERLPNNSVVEHRAEDLLHWTNNPALFFTNVAKRLLRKLPNHPGIDMRGENFRIPIYPTNFYTPAVHRLLQMTANIYDATQEGTPSGLAYSKYFPTVFRPVFQTENGTNVLIVGYREENGPGLITALKNPSSWVALAWIPWWELNSTNIFPGPLPRPVAANDFVYNVPLIIGAKKGYPNFNEFVLATDVVVERKIELAKTAENQVPNRTNQLYLLGINNRLGIETWNSYQMDYPRELELHYAVTLRTTLSDRGQPVVLPTWASTNANGIYKVPAGAWPAGSFRNIALTNFPSVVDLCEYRTYTREFNYPPAKQGLFETNGLMVPEWDLSVASSLIFFMVDTGSGRIVDMVSFSGLGHTTNILAALWNEAQIRRADGRSTPFDDLWDTNRLSLSPQAPTVGIINQIKVSTGDLNLPATDWVQSFDEGNILNTKDSSIAHFEAFLTANNLGGGLQKSTFTPARRLHLISSWQANDPLVHHAVEELRDELNPMKMLSARFREPMRHLHSPAPFNLNRKNDRYLPWPMAGDQGTDYALGFEYSLKDSLVRGSDDWDFPERKLPNIGLLGRIHRGTPWQSVYLKSPVASLENWHSHTGQAFIPESHPTNDWFLLDVFTVAPNDNASRGTLSINQTNQAAWSAVMSGSSVLVNKLDDTTVSTTPVAWSPVANTDPNTMTNVLIQPSSAEIQAMVAGINNFQQYHRQRGRFLHSLGEVLAVPELTVNSPFLNRAPDQRNHGITDEAYERIPQQVLSLLRVGEPRVVIYAYGQSLKPSSIARSGTGVGIPNNYRVTGEYATRTVVRFEDITDYSCSTCTNVLQRVRPVIESFNILPPE